jgi:hypothetical protein
MALDLEVRARNVEKAASGYGSLTHFGCGNFSPWRHLQIAA